MNNQSGVEPINCPTAIYASFSAGRIRRGILVHADQAIGLPAGNADQTALFFKPIMCLFQFSPSLACPGNGEVVSIHSPTEDNTNETRKVHFVGGAIYPEPC